MGLRLDSELGAATSAAAGNDQASLVGSHADPEPVGVAALDFFRLISAFHIGSWILAQEEGICHGGS